MLSGEFDVTFIVPIYNTPKSKMKQCIDSIGLIGKCNYEIVLIDDGSKEEIARYCDVVMGATLNCRCVHQQNKGVSSARNMGIANAGGRYIYFVDSDDVIIPQIFQKLAGYSQDLVFSDLLTEENGNLERWEAFQGTSRDITAKDVLQKMAKDGKLNGPYAKLIKTEFLRKNNITFREDMVLGEDAVFLMDMIACKPVMYYEKEDSYKYYKDLSTGVNRLLNQTELIIRNNIYMYHKLSDLILKNYSDDSQERQKVSAWTSERYIKQIFNTAAELLELHVFTKGKKILLHSAVDEVDHNYMKTINFMARIRLSILKRQLWCLLRIIASLRRIYLKIKPGNA